MILQDLRYGFRTMRKNPGFSATVVMSLALAIGANTAIFTLIDAVALRWLPVRDPQKLIQLRILESGIPGYSFSYPVVQTLAEQDDLFAGLCGFSGWTFHVGSPETAELRRGMAVTGGYFETLGLAPAAGRLLTDNDDLPGAAPVAVISHNYWERAFNTNPLVIGQPILIEGIPVPIVGVSRLGFTGPSAGEAIDVTITLAALPQLVPGTSGRLEAAAKWLRVLGRLRPGISADQLNDRLAVVWPPLAATTVTPTMTMERRREVEASSVQVVFGGTGWSALRAQYREPLSVLMVLVSLVLLIACANAANLMLTRASARQSELSLRRAVGATRGRIVRQLLTESVLLSIVASTIGIGLAFLGNRVLLALLSKGRQLPISLDLHPDWTILGFTSAVALTTGILFGLWPALRATAGGSGTMRVDSRVAGARSRLSSALVVAQVGLSLLLLIGTGLFVGTLRNLGNQVPGFRHEGVLLVGVDARRAGYRDARLAAAYRELLARIERLPGVVSASVSGDTPLSGRVWSDGVAVDGQPTLGNETAHFNRVGPGYFATMGTGLLVGREFTAADGPGSPAVAIVSETFVRRYLSGTDSLGQRISVPGASDRQHIEIVGVVRDTLSQSLREPPTPAVYLPYFQHPQLMTGATFEVYAAGSIAQVASSLRREVAARLPSTFPAVRPLTEQVEASMAKERVLAALASAFGLLALALASVGLYGLLAYTVSRRTREIGIRMAVGADTSAVMRAVVRQGLATAGIGIAAGLALAIAFTRFLGSLLFGVAPLDVPTLVMSVGAMLAAALLASYIPGRRATRVDPMVALRAE